MDLIDNKHSTSKQHNKVKPPAKQPKIVLKKTTSKPLTRKQEAFVNELLADKKMSGTQAVLKTYGKPDKELSYHTAGQIAHENLRKPEIVSRLAEHNSMIESVLTNTVQEYGYSDKIQERSLAVDTSKWLHDKIHGKAVQKSSSVNMNFTQHVTDNKYQL